MPRFCEKLAIEHKNLMFDFSFQIVEKCLLESIDMPLISFNIDPFPLLILVILLRVK